MRLRDLLIVAAVLLLGGFAAADALRGEADPPEPPGREETRPAETDRGAAPRVETIEGGRPGLLEGRLVYTDASCSLRRIDLAGNVVSDLGSVQTACALTAPVAAGRVAFNLPSVRPDAVPYRILDLDRPAVSRIGFVARAGSVVWSADGRRVAWCDRSGQGREAVGAESRALAGCPIAYLPDGRPAYADGRILRADEEPLLEAPESIVAVSFGPDGSIAVATRERLLLYAAGESSGPSLVQNVAVPPELRGLGVVFSPSHCHAALPSSVFPPAPTVFVLSLRPCPGGRTSATFAGRAAAWSPDGRHLAVAERQRVAVHPLFGSEPVVALRLAASALAWQE